MKENIKNKHSIILLAAVLAAFMISVLAAQTNAQTAKKVVRKKSAKIKTDPCKKLSANTFFFGSKDSNTSPENKSEGAHKTSDEKALTGVINGKAVNLVVPAYPPAAKAVHASGAVNVQVMIDQKGNVVSASAVSGHPLLRQSAEIAARTSTFSPTMLSGCPVRVAGIVVYNFVAQ